MSFLRDLFKAASASLMPRRRNRPTVPGTAPKPTGSKKPGSPSPRPSGARPVDPRPSSTGSPDLDSPGRSGAQATKEIDPRSVRAVHTAYQPERDGDADPGEIVWTWVPYEENDGRGKDRPVLVVAREKSGSVLAVQLTSKAHDDDDHVAIGTGAWDSEGRPSWVRLDRVFRVQQGGLRREACALDRKPFDRVNARLTSRYGWR